MLNVRCSINAMMRLIRHGECVPVSPLAMTTLCHLVQPLHYEQWMDFDFDLIETAMHWFESTLSTKSISKSIRLARIGKWSSP